MATKKRSNDEGFATTGIVRKGDYHKRMDAPAFGRSAQNLLRYSLAKDDYSATAHDRYLSVALAVRERLIERWIKTQQTYYKRDAKRVYYLSMEFLLGRTLTNALINLGIDDDASRALFEMGQDLEALRDLEPDAGLGNGGLGRLAACYLDSMASLQLPATGYGLRYDFGIFRQRIADGHQIEEPDPWLKLGNPWEIERPENAYRVQFGGRVRESRDGSGRPAHEWVDTDDVVAMPYDTPIPGYANNTVNNLRLWSAKSVDAFDLDYFNDGDYIRAVEKRALSENITRVLYPADRTFAGQELRLQQEYLLVSASLQDILRRYKVTHKTFDAFADRVAVQLNDTHPALAIPELLRLLVDRERLEWDAAWDLTVRVFGYTNHTLMPEALERWSVGLMERLLPRHLQILYEVNARFLGEVERRFPGDAGRLRRMSLIEEEPERKVRMANLAIVGSHATNGVSELHTELLKQNVVRDFAELFPERFRNITNGVTPRRWMRAANPGLSALITSRIGDGWVRNLEELRRLEPSAEDAGFRQAWREVKRRNKERLAAAIERAVGVRVDPAAMFDVHVKRLHEYKRQHLNVMRVIDHYLALREGRAADAAPRVVIFGGKAAPSYHAAKLVIRLIHHVADKVNGDRAVGDRLKVVFVPDYSVSWAERIVPAADLSEQISTAGLEASGTGNMKFALNGALTIGTLDGANIEIRRAVGEENFFLFGLTAAGIAERRARGYDPGRGIAEAPRLARVLGWIDESEAFRPLTHVLRTHDPFMLVADFDSYVRCQEAVGRAWGDGERWARMSVLNVARSGGFSSDRAILEYAREIWGVEPVPIVLE